MPTIFIDKVLVDDKPTNILIKEGIIAGIGTQVAMPADALYLSGVGYAAFPTFANCHTHAAMSLFRGYGDDQPLERWLNQWIWPKEKHLDDDIVYWGTRLACLEMVKSGTTCLNDMYFHLPAAARAIADSGLRAVLGMTVMDFHNSDNATELRHNLESFDFDALLCPDGRIATAVAPHAIYTVSEASLRWTADFCAERGWLYHIHTSETEKEVQDCIDAHGCRPYEYLDRIGVLEKTTHRFIGAHCLHLSDHEIELMGHYHVNAVHNPNSNLKLASGHAFRYEELCKAAVNVALGTDGCASSNNLDMIEAAKTMSLLQKGWRCEPTAMPAAETLRVATANGYHAMGLNGGKLEQGALADLMLVDLNNLAFVPNNNSLSNLIYAAHGDAVDTVICNGTVLMHHRQVDNEQTIINEARKASLRLLRS